MKPTAIVLALAAWFCLTGCASGPLAPAPTETLSPTETSRPTATPTLTPTATPTETPLPTATRTERPTVQATATLPAAPGGTPVSVLLRMNLHPEDEFHVRLLTEQQINQTIEGQSFDTEQRIGYEYSYRVASVDGAGNSWVEVVYTWVHFEQDTVLASVLYDSENPPAEIPQGAEAFSALVGSGFSMLITPQGKVLEIEGLEAMYDRMLAEIDFDDPALEQQFRQTISQQFGEETLKQQMNNTTLEFPEGEIQVGDSWTASAELTSGTPMLIQTTNTLQAVEGSIATVDVHSTVRPNPEAGPIEFGMFQIEYNVSGEQNGVVQVDLESGLSSSQVRQSLSGEMVMAAEGQRVTVPLSIRSLIQVEVSRITP